MHQFYREIENANIGLGDVFALMLWIMNMAAGIAAFIDTDQLISRLWRRIAYAIAKGGVSQSRDQALLNFAGLALSIGGGWGFSSAASGIAGA